MARSHPGAPLERVSTNGCLAWRPGWPLAWGLIALLRGYRRFLSPLLGPACRFEPSCSVYAIAALSDHGLPRALWLVTWRLLRCQPLCRGGQDPVPPGRFARSPAACCEGPHPHVPASGGVSSQPRA